ncbi:phosphonoacetaldehyde hydrolase [Peribacillus simplex]|uniref:phosphonoacetaldehyde hydrolase n=1 Tax=Peribacillus simplex TaxID=1478 RepID=UPI003D283F2B
MVREETIPKPLFPTVFLKNKHSVDWNGRYETPAGNARPGETPQAQRAPRADRPRKASAQYGRPFNEEDVEKLYAEFEPALMMSLADYTDPIPGVIETVEALRNRGLKIGSTTGYTDTMMEVVVANALKKGYRPDFHVTPDATHSIGRPYPYMIYRNMEELKLTASWKVVKVGDTISDMQEGVNAGVWSVGIIVGSSEMGLSLNEYTSLPERDKQNLISKTADTFMQNGADFTIKTIEELPELIDRINLLITEGKRPHSS